MTQRVCLINSPSLRKRAVSRSMAGGLGFDGSDTMVLPPLDLALMAATLRNAGYDVELIDADALRLNDHDVYVQLAHKEYRVIIASVSLPTLDNDAEFISGLKRLHPEALVFAKTLVRDQNILKQLLHKSHAHLIIHGEADLSIPHIITGEIRDGTAWLENDDLVFIPNKPVSDLNELPFPARDLLPNDRYTYPLLGSPVATLQTSRGCPFPCGYYCPYPLVEGKTWRAQKPERIFAELQQIVERLGIHKIYFRDATFTLDKERIVRLCDLIIAADWQIEWMCETRVDCLDDDLLGKMKAAGCVGMLIGVETGDERVMHRKEGKKGLTVTKLAHLREKTRELGLKLHFLLMVGLPHETRESTVATYDLIMRYDPDTIGVTIITPYPGTPLYYDAQREGWIESYNWRDYGGHQAVMHTSHFSREDLIAARSFIEDGFALRQRERAEGKSLQLEHLKKRHYLRLLSWAYRLDEIKQQARKAMDTIVFKGQETPANHSNPQLTVNDQPADQHILISVIIPTYNRKGILHKTLLAFSAQTLEPEKFEVIVIDDGSTDDTLTMLKKMKTPFLLRVLSQEHQGPNAARNLGVQNAQGWIVLFTGDDMIPGPLLLESHLRFHQRYQDEYDAMLGFIDWSPEINITPLMRYIVSPEGGQQFAFHEVQEGKANFRHFYTSNISLKRSLLLRQSKLFDTDFIYPAWDDIELGYRLQRQGLRLHYRSEAVTYHHHEITTEGFVQRQHKAGEMAVIFARKHPELDKELLGVEEILHLPNHLDENTFKGLLEVVRELEKPDTKKLATLQVNGKSLDMMYAQTILYPFYSTLLRSAYIIGVLEGAKAGNTFLRFNQPDTLEKSVWPEEAFTYIRQADEYISQGNFVAAREALDRALDLAPDAPELIAALGHVLLYLGDVEAAHREFAKATTLAPHHAPFHTDLATVLLYLGRMDEAESSLRRALALDPTDTRALKLLAHVCLNNKHYAEGIRAYVDVLRQNPNDIDALLSLGNCYLAAGHLDSARIMYKRVLEVDPHNAVAAENLAIANGEVVFKH